MALWIEICGEDGFATDRATTDRVVAEALKGDPEVGANDTASSSIFIVTKL